MFHLTLRELLLLTALAATSIAWRVESQANDKAQSALHTTRSHARMLKENLSLAKGECLSLEEFITTGCPTIVCGNSPFPDWTLADQEIP